MIGDRGNSRTHCYTELTAILSCNRSHHSVPRMWRFTLSNGGRKPNFFTRSIKAKCRDKEVKLPETQRIVQDVDGSCIAVTADLCIIPIGEKNIDDVQNVVSRLEPNSYVSTKSNRIQFDP